MLNRLDPTTIAVFVEGGVVQDVLANTPGMRVVVIDYDTEGVDAKNLSHVKLPANALGMATLRAEGNALGEPCLASEWIPNCDPRAVEAAVNATAL